MRLKAQHTTLLNPLERKVYASLIGQVDPLEERKSLFLSQSLRYVDGDETKLPFPERSKRGVMLFALSKQLASSSTNAVAVYRPLIPRHALHIKRKLLEKGTERVFAVPALHLLAAIYAEGKNPFHFFRDKPDLELENLDTYDMNSIVCSINPLAASVASNPEYDVIGLLIRKSLEEEDVTKAPLFAEAAHLGLSQVTEVFQNKFWLTKER